MKLALTIPVLAAMLATSGCTNLYTADPFVADNESILAAGLAGTWTKDGDTLLIREKGKDYLITYLDDKTPLQFVGRLARVGDDLLMDVIRDVDEPFVVPMHFGVRLWLEGNSLRWTLLDVPDSKDRKRPLIVPGDALRNLATDDRAYGKSDLWHRVN